MADEGNAPSTETYSTGSKPALFTCPAICLTPTRGIAPLYPLGNLLSRQTHYYSVMLANVHERNCTSEVQRTWFSRPVHYYSAT